MEFKEGEIGSREAHRADMANPNDDATQILLYELYRDAAAFEVHWHGPSIARLREEAGSMIVKIYGTRCALSE